MKSRANILAPVPIPAFAPVLREVCFVMLLVGLAGEGEVGGIGGEEQVTFPSITPLRLRFSNVEQFVAIGKLELTSNEPVTLVSAGKDMLRGRFSALQDLKSLEAVRTC